MQFRTTASHLRALLIGCACLLTAPALAGPNPAAEAQTLDILKRAIAFRSVQGPGNQTPQLAAYLKSVLVAGGFAADDVTITPVEDSAFLVARYRGSDAKLKPLLLSGHMDVVEAKPADWQRDPFTAVIENGYVYGRGATDMKFGDALMIATLVELKRTGFKPKRDVILILSGDEETTMKTTEMLAAQFPDAYMLLNADGGGGNLSEEGKPTYFALEGAEKAYGDYTLTFTNPGGHSSAPRRENAIYELAAALTRIGNYQFTPQLNDITRAYFVAAADRAEPKIGAAMRAFAANPADKQAIATLSADPAYVGKIGTTCVATMVNAGHALNALPQRASANINCRIFPGTSFKQIEDELVRVAADPKMQIQFIATGTTASPASPMRADVTAAVKEGLAFGYPNVPIIPSMSSGASDSMWFRVRGVPSYGVAPIFLKDSDDFSHGLNERTQLSNIEPGVAYWKVLIKRLSN
ncbi:M20/M25/M40 family metallo-hydrolase [Sphingomonas crusticola]|uniref:M20/M25/M40 family metallo-hydrolase n=1 Tax=Sphingomonas crusticola TaxID=1697973 RepID=UPI000E21C9E1|nr:M20/M25/M40 family metallo-hydrolase [Sphingomonas crusticola]